MKRRTSLKATLGTIGAMLPASFAKGIALSNTAQDDFFDVIHNRRSVRHFRSDPVPTEDLNKILDAARMAPMSGNQQPWKFLVLQDKNRIEALKEFCIKKSIEKYTADRNPSKSDLEKRINRTNEYYHGYLSAPLYVVILTDNNSQYPDYNHWDGPLAAANLMLAARALGYGTVFISDSISTESTKEFFRIPDHYTRVCITPSGIPLEWPKSPEKKPLGEFIVMNTF